MKKTCPYMLARYKLQFIRGTLADIETKVKRFIKNLLIF